MPPEVQRKNICLIHMLFVMLHPPSEYVCDDKENYPMWNKLLTLHKSNLPSTLNLALKPVFPIDTRNMA